MPADQNGGSKHVLEQLRHDSSRQGLRQDQHPQKGPATVGQIKTKMRQPITWRIRCCPALQCDYEARRFATTLSHSQLPPVALP